MPKPLWTLGEMAKAVRGKSSMPPRTPVSGVSIDSRSLAPDEAFIALRGFNRDGHLFVAAALSQGASFAIVEQVFKAPRHRIFVAALEVIQVAVKQMACVLMRPSCQRLEVRELMQKGQPRVEKSVAGPQRGKGASAGLQGFRGGQRIANGPGRNR